MGRKIRLDQLLVERGLAKSRSQAQRMILAGEVRVDGQIVDKPASQIPPSAILEIKSTPKYVSQGGLKLEKALEVFEIDVQERVCLDIGSSTGGFTDCLLQHGASKVYSVDVGKGQLDWKLRNDQRVVVMESINARYLSADDFEGVVDLATADVSFISLKLILPPLLEIVNADGELVLLVKPQFEAGPEHVERGGVVKAAAVHRAVLEELAQFTEDDLNLSIQNATFSPFKGPAGNIEFLLHLVVANGTSKQIDWSKLVSTAHEKLP